MTTNDVALEQIVAALREGKRVRAVLHPNTKADALVDLLSRAGVAVSRSSTMAEGQVGVFVDQGVHYAGIFGHGQTVG